MTTTVAPNQCDIPRNPSRLDTSGTYILDSGCTDRMEERKYDRREKQSIRGLQPSRDILTKKENQSDKKMNDSCMDDSYTIHYGIIQDLNCSGNVTPVAYVLNGSSRAKSTI